MTPILPLDLPPDIGAEATLAKVKIIHIDDNGRSAAFSTPASLDLRERAWLAFLKNNNKASE